MFYVLYLKMEVPNQSSKSCAQLQQKYSQDTGHLGDGGLAHWTGGLFSAEVGSHNFVGRISTSPAVPLITCGSFSKRSTCIAQRLT